MINIKKEKEQKFKKCQTQQEIFPKVSGLFLALNILSKYPSTTCLMEKKYVWTAPIDSYSLFPPQDYFTC